MTEITLHIDGMMCGMCESHVNDAIRKAFKVKKVNSSHTKSRTVIESEEALNEDALRKAIAETGYEVKGITSETFEKKGLFGRPK